MPTPRIGNLETERIAHIMTVALKEFAENNYTKSSYNRIIKNCGMSKGTMYYYFESKQDLFMTLLTAVTKDFQNIFAQSTPALGNKKAFWLEVERLLGILLATFQKKPVLGRFMQNLLTLESRSGINPASAMIDAIDEWLEDFIVTGQLLDAIRRDIPNDLILQICWGVWETISAWLQTAAEPSKPEHTVSIMLDLLQRSLQHLDAEDEARNLEVIPPFDYS